MEIALLNVSESNLSYVLSFQDVKIPRFIVGSLIPLKSFPNFLMKKTKSITGRNNVH